MFGSEILEVAIGLSLIFLLMSALCSAVREAIESFFKTRAAELHRGIGEMLRGNGGDVLVKKIYENPLVSALYRGRYDEVKPTGMMSSTNLPSYIPSANFAAALLSEGEDVARQALGVAGALGVDTAALQANIEAWYDSTMDRVSGWYKRRTQVHLFVLGLLLAIAMNVDTIHLVNYLTRNDAARTALVERAKVAATDTAVVSTRFDSAYAHLDSLGLPIGWGKDGGPPFSIEAFEPEMGWTLLGWLLTAFAITLGAPFWFDVLNKFIVIRSTVKPHEKSPEEGSEDRKGVPGGGVKRVRLPGAEGGTGAQGAGSGGDGSARSPVDTADLVDPAIGGPDPAHDARPTVEDATLKDVAAPQAPQALLAAAAAPKVFDTAARNRYVDSILKDTSRFDFLRPAQQDWIDGNWFHSFEKDGKTFRMAASWGDTKAGKLTITRESSPGAPFSTGRATFCNFNVSYCFHEAYGGPCLQFMNGKEHTANDLVDLLSHEWEEISAAEAAKIANKGGFVIAGKKASPHGHVVFLLEGSDEGGNPALINTFHVGGGLPRKRTVANIWGSLDGVHFVTPPATLAAFKQGGGQ